NADGKVEFGTGLALAGQYSVADRDYFQRLKDNPRLGMVVSEPLFSRSLNRWALVCARAFYGADGRFGGIVSAVIEIDHLTQNVLGQQPDLGKDGVFGLGDDQMNLILRFQHNQVDESGIGTKIVSPDFRKMIASRVESVNYTDHWPLDPIERVGYFKRVPGVPMSIAVGLGVDEVLDGWRQDAWIAVVTTILFAAAVGGASWALYRARLRQLSTMEELAGTLNFNRQIIEHSDIGICVHRQDGQCIQANPAMSTIVGGTQEELLQVNFRNLESFKQFGALELADDTLKNGNVHRLQVKAVTLFGKELWLQCTFTSFVERGERFLLTLWRDVTAIQEAREELELGNRQLELLSTTDGLTGIANRRRFDDVLATEWRRAARQSQPLALAMIDVDLFKKYNDHYGHQDGDECLRQVASVLKRRICRAGDLVARYGGEEFVFLCPATTAETVLALAEAFRAELEKLALPHEQSPFGVVTVSIGVAAMVPDNAEQANCFLLRLADEALYLAKRDGRNRVALGESNP
ncbi:MAG: diguanylate cyclase, partial [Burkholderiaceae bacterium]|nr:diguanylate cyclase [Burkholderiaceae bacterium]